MDSNQARLAEIEAGTTASQFAAKASGLDLQPGLEALARRIGLIESKPAPAKASAKPQA
jgi:hypothetical protein